MNEHLISSREFKNYVSKICRDIIISNWKPDYIVGLTRGGLIPAVMISHYLNVPMLSLNVSLRDSGEATSDLTMAEDAFGYNEGNSGGSKFDTNRVKNILIVDDINDTGATFNWIINDWQQSCLPQDPRWEQVWNNNVKFAVIVDNLSSKCEVTMDYSAIEVDKSEEDVWITFPYESWWNL